MAKLTNPAMELSAEEIAAIRARLPGLDEPLKISPALKKALKLKVRIEDDREGRGKPAKQKPRKGKPA